MWRCRKCEEDISDSLECCWNCGTTPDGAEDPLFQPEPNDPMVPDPGPGSEETEEDILAARPLQFSLRSLMIAVAVVAVLTAIKSMSWQNERRERAILEQLRPYGAQAYFQNGSVRALRFTQSGEPLGDEALPLVREFRKLRDLNLTHTDVTIEGIARLEGMRYLKVIFVDEVKLSQDSLCHYDRARFYHWTYILVEVRPGQPPIYRMTVGPHHPIGHFGVGGRKPTYE